MNLSRRPREAQSRFDFQLVPHKGLDRRGFLDDPELFGQSIKLIDRLRMPFGKVSGHFGAIGEPPFEARRIEAAFCRNRFHHYEIGSSSCRYRLVSSFYISVSA